jgi:arylsulfatase A-like enzyme
MSTRTPRTAARRPNIVFFLTDDQSKSSMGAYGNPVLQTPHMDRIANEGFRAEQFFVTNSMCQPSRASFITGLYSHRHGVTTNGEGPEWPDVPKLARRQRTLAHLFGGAGYVTQLIGKWHIYSDPRGFTDWRILDGQGPYFDPVLLGPDGPTPTTGHTDDVIGDRSAAFVQRQTADQPFMLLCWFKAPHRSWEPAPRFADAYASTAFAPPSSFDDTLEGRSAAVRCSELSLETLPDFAERGVPADLPAAQRKRLNYEAMMRNYYRVLLGADDNVGKVLAALDRKGFTDDTIVVFSSDNGFFLGEHGFFDKRLMYEPALRVPLALRYPRLLRTPRVDSDHLLLNIDIAPTLLDLAGRPVPRWMQGKSFAPMLLGKNPAFRQRWRDAFMYEYFEFPANHCVRKHRGVRTERWKLINFFEQPEQFEMYDLQADPDECHNLADDAAHAPTLAALRARLAALRDELGDHDPPGPTPVSASCSGAAVDEFQRATEHILAPAWLKQGRVPPRGRR